MKFKVTTESIKLGTRGDSERCPVALAILDVCRSRNIYVGDDEIAIDVYRFETPDAILNFICRFDSGLGVFPFSFELDLAPESLKDTI